MPKEISFSRPSTRYLNRQPREPLGLSKRYRPRPSKILIAFGPGFAWRMTTSLSGMIEPRARRHQKIQTREVRDLVRLTFRSVIPCSVFGEHFGGSYLSKDPWDPELPPEMPSCQWTRKITS